MINSIQSYQNTPKLTSNKAKANNSPSFGMKVDCEIVTVGAKNAIEAMQTYVRNRGKSSEILTPIKTWISETGNLLRPLESDEFQAELRITNIDTCLDKIRAELKVRHGDLAVHLSDIDESAIPQNYLVPKATTNEDGVYLDPQCVRVKAEKLIKKLKELARNRDNAKSDLQAGDDLLKLVKLPTT